MAAALPITLSALRRAVSALEPSEAAREADRFRLGFPSLDGWLGGGLASGGLHEVYAVRVADAAATPG